jgi:hypothetical protein
MTDQKSPAPAVDVVGIFVASPPTEGFGMNPEKPERKEKPKPICSHVHDHVVCAGRGAAFNIYRCRYCGDEEWL